jgi:hypothetical protein
MDNKILCRELFLQRGKTQESLPHKDFGICGRDQFPRQGCRPGEKPSIANVTLGKAQSLCPTDRWEATLPKILGMKRKPKPTLTFRGEDCKQFLVEHNNRLDLLLLFLENLNIVPEDITSMQVSSFRNLFHEIA